MYSGNNFQSTTGRIFISRSRNTSFVANYEPATYASSSRGSSLWCRATGMNGEDDKDNKSGFGDNLGSSSWQTSPRVSAKITGDADCPVPSDQQPIVEYKSLEANDFFKLASTPLPDFLQRCFILFLATDMLIGLPIAHETYFDPAVTNAPLAVRVIETVVAGSGASIAVVTLFILRLYFGWSYVGNRLLSASVVYEETGWYDGETWVKSTEIRERDRLMSLYQVKPIVERLKKILLACSLLITLSIVSLGLLSDKFTEKRYVNYGDDASVTYKRAFTSQEDLIRYQKDTDKYE